MSANEPVTEPVDSPPAKAPELGALQEDAWCGSFLLFSWVSPLLSRGSDLIAKGLVMEEQDLLALPHWEVPANNAEELKAAWAEELVAHPEAPSLIRPLRKVFGTRVIVGGICRFLSDGSAFAAPFLLRQLIVWLQDPGRTNYAGFLWAIALTFANLLMSTMLNQSGHHTVTGMQQMSNALQIMVFDAALRHPIHHDTGKLTSAHVVDPGKFIEMAVLIHGLWVSPILVIGAVIALYFFIGWAGLVAVGLMIVFIPIQIFFMQFIGVQNREKLNLGKRTLAAVNEALQGIRICKFMNWDGPFAQRIGSARANEVGALRRMYVYKVISMNLMVAIPSVILFVLFSVASAISDNIDPQNVFPALAMVSVIRIPLMFIPMALSKMFELQFSLNRIQSVLLGQRVDPVVQNADLGDSAVVLRNASVLKDDGSPLMTFDEVKIPKSMLTVIVGPTGSGKTTLALSLLGEVKLAPGATVEHSECCGFVPQEAWLMNATVRENILMGAAFNRERYDAVISACQLEADMVQLPDGDQTEVGERGITLSGGQKQRISLARAAYCDREMIIMDDPLSAVDPQVRKGLFFDCMLGLMAKKTRVLVTHQTQFLPHVQNIIRVDENHRVAFTGTYSEYVRAGFAVEETTAGPEQTPEPSPKSAADVNASVKGEEKTHKLMATEETKLGDVAWAVYGWYVRLGGIGCVVCMLIAMACWRAASLLSDLWVSWWTGRQPAFGHSYSTHGYMLWYGVTIIVSIVFMAIRLNFFRTAMLNFASGCHADLTRSLIRAPISFYDTTPMGRILNRFSKDIDVLDLRMPDNLNLATNMIFMIFGMIAMVGYSTPYILIMFPFLALVYRFMYKYYARTIRGVKRLEGTLRSPFMAIMNETIGGLATIRAFGAVEKFSEEHARRAARAVRPTYATRMCQRWLMGRTETMGSTIILVTAMLACLATVLANKSWTTHNSAGIVALSLTYAMSTTNNISMFARIAADIEADMSSTERLKEYSEDVPQERDVVYGPEHPAPGPNWPASGTVEFDNVDLRYRPGLPLVLKGLSFAVKSGEKIGVVGRTGSGKSTIMLTLFRMIELAGGCIRLDGFDIAQLSLDDLRKNVTIIPQDPVLFLGTVRSNLDPFSMYDDATIWSILDKVGLKKRVEEGIADPESPGTTQNQGARGPSNGIKEVSVPSERTPTLLAPVAEKGGNFSVGERQLMCLARALLKKSRVLLLDEATASVDYDADATIQRTIRTEFAHCTVLTIAHRLATVVDADRILVLDNGTLREFDTPDALLSDTDSAFYSMAVPLGETQLAELKAKARSKQAAAGCSA